MFRVIVCVPPNVEIPSDMNTTESPSLDIHREGFVAGNPKVEVLEGIAHLYKQRCTGETKGL